MTKRKSKIDDDSVLKEIPKLLPVLPLRDNIIFPYMIFPVLLP